MKNLLLKSKKLTRKYLTNLILVALISLKGISGWGQVSGYTFAQSAGTYNEILYWNNIWNNAIINARDSASGSVWDYLWNSINTNTIFRIKHYSSWFIGINCLYLGINK